MWTHVLADLLIGIARVVVSGALAYLADKARRDVPFCLMFLAFGWFIVACGATHFMEVITAWNPVYVLSGLVKVFTARWCPWLLQCGFHSSLEMFWG